MLSGSEMLFEFIKNLIVHDRIYDTTIFNNLSRKKHDILSCHGKGVKELMYWECEIYQKAFTDWLLRQIKKEEVTPTKFLRRVGLTAKADLNLIRRARKGTRRWNLKDICKSASYINMNPSEILSIVELTYKKHMSGAEILESDE